MENAKIKQLREFMNHVNLVQYPNWAIYKEMINIDSTAL